MPTALEPVIYQLVVSYFGNTNTTNQLAEGFAVRVPNQTALVLVVE